MVTATQRESRPDETATEAPPARAKAALTPFGVVVIVLTVLAVGLAAVALFSAPAPSAVPLKHLS